MNFEYPLYHFDDRFFENLVVRVCQKLLGIGINGFNATNDGGRDARFEGTSQYYPSVTSLWKGKFIIQAKYTKSPIALCSESAFRTEVDKELIKVKKLKDNDEIDNYILFTNRSLTGEEFSSFTEKAKKTTYVPNTAIHGKEDINRYLLQSDDIVKEFNLDKWIIPLNFDEDDLKDLILLFDRNKEEFSEEVEKNFKRINVEEKNKKNNLSEEYFEFIKTNSLPYFSQIDNFLKSPINRTITDKYLDTTSELKSKIIVHRNEFKTFETIFEYIYNYIISKHEAEFGNKKRLVWTFLHYMYYNCDIGS